MASVGAVLVFLALAGAIASWIVGAVYFARTLAALGREEGSLKWIAIVAWPFAIGRLKGAAAEPAAMVNKALVAFFVCLLVAMAATAATTNLQRIGK